MGPSPLNEVFARLRRRAQFIGSGAGLFWGIVAALCLLVAAIWCDLALELAPTSRLVAVMVAALLGVVSCAALFLWTLSQSKPFQIARRLDSAGATGGQIRSGMDLSRELVIAQTAPAPEICADLARIAIQRAAALASLVPPAQVVPLRPLAMASLAALATAAAIFVASLLMPELARTQWLRFSDPFGDHPPYAASRFLVEPADAKVRYGDGLDIFVSVEGKPVETLELVLQPTSSPQSSTEGEVVPMFQEPGGKWRAALTNVVEGHHYFVRAYRARSPKYSIDVITVPEIKDVRFRVTQPDYARRSVYEGPLPAAGITGLAGAKVEVFVASNRPLAAANAKLVSQEKAEAFHWPASENSLEAQGFFTITRSGRLDLTVTDVDQQACKEAFSAPIVLLPDERPLVRLMEPKPVSFATPNSLLPVVISAEDDYGVARLQLFRTLNDSRYLPQEIPPGSPPPTIAHQGVRLPLADYELTPGDEIKVFARAEDNDPAGAKGAESPIAIVRIISEEEFNSMVRSREGANEIANKYNQIQRRMEDLARQAEELAEKLKKLPPDSPLAEDTRKELEELAERMQEEAEAIEKLAESELPYDLDKELKQHAAKTAKSLEQLAQEMKKLSEKQGLPNETALEELKNLQAKLGNERKQLQEQTGPPIDQLLAAYPLMEDAERFVEIYERQKDLTERLGAFRGKDPETDPSAKARMRELEAEQKQIREDLLRLLDDIEDHAAQLPDSEQMQQLRQQAEEFAAAVRESGADGEMQQCEGSLNEFSGSAAVDAAARARDILDSFIKKCNGMSEQASNCMCLGFQPTISNCLSQTAAQLLAQAGFGKGRGQENGRGEGSGGGYSARRSSLQNVGLYGNQPRESSPSQGMRNGVANSAQSGRLQSRGSSGSGDPSTAQMNSSAGSGGEGEAAVPAQYRRKVGRYFQRIADEVGGADR